MADKKTEETKESMQVMDVSKPGKTAADATARPIIIGHGSMAQDPMVNPAENKNPDAPEKKPDSEAIPVGKKIILPISEQEKSAEEIKETTPEQAEEPKTPDAEAKPEAEPEPAEPQETSGESSSDSAVVDAVADQVDVKKQELADEEDKKKQEAINKLVSDKKYFVPIGKAHKKSRNFTATFILLVLVVVIGVVLAIDAGLLDIGVDLPIDLIK